MKKILAISAREWRAAFENPLAYVVTSVFLAVGGYFFFLLLVTFASVYPRAAGGAYGPLAFTVDEQIVRPWFENMGLILVILVPALSMRLVAEERRQGTVELLLTVPLRAAQAIVGKFLGALGTGTVMLVSTLPFFIVLSGKSDPDWGLIASGYLGLWLLTGACLSIGLMMSALTENQIIAYCLGFLSSLGLWLAAWLGDVGQGGWEVLEFVSLQSHLQDFNRGVLDTTHLVYFGSVASGFLFGAARALESQRWR